MKRQFSSLSLIITAGFFVLLCAFAWMDMYGAHFNDRGAIVIAYQFARLLVIPYLFWLQYAAGAYVFYRMAHRAFPFMGLQHVIASFLLGASLWHVVLLIVGLAGGYHYVVMLLMAGGVMLASLPHMSAQLSNCRRIVLRKLALDEKILAALVLVAALAFLFIKGAYPSGGHDFYNHYFPYYMEVITSGNLGPHNTWYQYFYSKGMGLYFMSMILFDPMAVHLAATSFIVVAAFIVFDFLRTPRSKVLPLFGVFVYLICYIYTSGRGLFAANGGWGDLEKTHEIGAVVLLGCVWLVYQATKTRNPHYAPALYMVSVAGVIISFANAPLCALFYASVWLLGLVRKELFIRRLCVRAAFVTMFATAAMLVINYINTGVPQDQLAVVFWPFIDWQKVVNLGITLELYAHFYTMNIIAIHTLPLWKTLPKMLMEYYRLYMLWPVLLIGCVLYLSRRRLLPVENSAVILCFLAAGYVLAIFGGGREQFLSFFRFSTFNYAPVLILCLLLWRTASDRLLRYAVFTTLVAGCCVVVWGASINPPNEGKVTYAYWAHFKVGEWKKLIRGAYLYNTGQNSLADAIQNQHGRVGRMKWGGIHPAMKILYAGLPAGTRVWSIYNQSYCIMPGCNVQQYFSQIISPRWYDIALGSIEEGKKIMQEEGLNFIYYSRNINSIPGSDTKDQLSAFYKGLSIENIGKTYGILWTNGWDYLLTWKENSIAPLDEVFLDSWREYQERSTLPRKARFPVDKLAILVKKSIEEKAKHPPMPDW
jgi:hypothetical protein